MIRIDGSPLRVSDIAALARREAWLEFTEAGRACRSADYAQIIATQRVGADNVCRARTLHMA
jgi:hypothetical protein